MSKLETNTIDTLSGSTNLTIGSTNSSTVTFENGSPTGHMYPAFEATLTSNQTISDATRTTINFNSKTFDTDNCYDNTTNYRFTPTVAGKYFCYANANLDSQANSNLNTAGLYFLKNGSTTEAERITSFLNNPARYYNAPIYKVIDFNGTTDYIVVQAYIDDTSGSPVINGSASDTRTNFGAYRIGA